MKKLLALALALVLVFSLAGCYEDEQQGETTAPAVVAKTKLPAEQQAVVDYLNSVIRDSMNEKPGFKKEVKFGVDDFETENSTLKAAVPTLKNMMLNKQSDEVELGNNGADLFPLLTTALRGEDVESAECIESTSLLEPDDEGETIKPDKWAEADKFYMVTVTLPASLTDEAAARYFTQSSKSDILTQFQKAKDYLIVSDYTQTLEGITITCKVEKETDRIVELNVEEVFLITTEASGAGPLATAGDMPISFKFVKNTSFHGFSWPVDEAETTEA